MKIKYIKANVYKKMHHSYTDDNHHQMTHKLLKYRGENLNSKVMCLEDKLKYLM